MTNSDNPTTSPVAETLLEFPCEFPIKVFGKGADDFEEVVRELVAAHLEPQARLEISVRASSRGRYLAATCVIVATSKAQLDAIYQSLTDHDRILMSL